VIIPQVVPPIGASLYRIQRIEGNGPYWYWRTNGQVITDG
jgi:hypothetical protein